MGDRWTEGYGSTICVIPLFSSMIAYLETMSAYNETVLFSPTYEINLRTLELKKVKKGSFNRVKITLENDIRCYGLYIPVEKSEKLLAKIGTA